jgi:hypothetical protein
MRAGRGARRADAADHLTRADLLARSDQDGRLGARNRW